jgi:hypothetical protein
VNPSLTTGAAPAKPALATKGPQTSGGTAAAGTTAGNPDLRQITKDTNAVQQVETDLLGGATPEVKEKYAAMLSQLASGKMTMSDIRAQAKAAMDQMRAYKKELGPEADAALDNYMVILEKFLKEAPGSDDKVTLSPTPGQKSP